MLGFFSVCAALIIAAALAVPMAPITNAVSNASAAEEEPLDVLRIGFMQKVDSLNPYVGVSDAAYVFYGLVYDTLDVIDEDQNPVPSVAKDLPWAVPETDQFLADNNLPYGSVWQYNLSRNIMFSDGQPVTADDVVWNINLNADNYTNLWAFQPYAYFMDYAFAVDEYTVRIVFFDRGSGDPMPASYPYLLSIYILPKHKMRTMNAPFIGYQWTGVFEGEDQPIVGTGPFIADTSIYSSWVAGDPIVLNRNPDYFWGPEYNKTIKFDQIKMIFYDDTLSMQIALENGNLDIAQFPPTTYYDIKKRVNEGKLEHVAYYDGPKVTQYWTDIGICDSPNSKIPSRLDPVIKKAMAMATDKSYIIDNFYLGLADEGTTVIPPINPYWHYEPTAAEKINFNLQAARDLLQANGYIDTDSDGIRECTATSPAVLNNWVSPGQKLTYEMLIRAEYPEEKEIAKWLDTQWNSVGIDFNYIVVDEPTLNTIVYSYEYDLFIWYWSSDVDPNYQLFEATSMAIGGWNDIYYHSQRYDENYTMSVKTMDKAQRKIYTDNAQRILYEDCNYIILAYVYQTYAWRTDTFQGYGDWNAHPARSIDNFWSGNPLWFNITRVPPPPPPEFPWMLVIGGVVAAAVVVGVIVYFKMRGGKKPEGDGSSPLGD